MRVSGDWLTSKDTQAVLGMLSDAGYQAYCVGGAVRNALLGVEVADVDITTNAVPEKVMELAERNGLKAVPTGLDHGTITVVSNGIGHEVTTFRKDVATDGRRAVVAYAKTIAEDALRRDFTMNALYVAADGTLYDPLGGLEDINARRIRFIGDAAQRIQEDYLRILRFFRFHAWYGDPEHGFDAESLAACAIHAEGIGTVSKERIGIEMRKLLAARDPAPALAGMRSCGVLTRILPGTDPKFIPQLKHMEQELGIDPSWMRRLYILGGEHPSKLLRLSRDESKYYNSIERSLGYDYKLTVAGYAYGAERAKDVCLIKAVTLNQPLPPNFLEMIDYAAKQVFPITSADIMARGVVGMQIGYELMRCKDAWLACEFRIGKEELLRG